MPFLLEAALRLLLACVLGGIIGYEREHTNRPAGFRTHILVCAGAALVMVTSDYICTRYAGSSDPARLGAQVISGIGFLGAGTIIRDGVNVRGLTTAASLWAVSCVGIAAGIGFYGGAIIAAAMVFATLIILKKAERRFNRRDGRRTLIVETDGVPGRVEAVSGVLERSNAQIRSMQLYRNRENNLVIKLQAEMPGAAEEARLLDGLLALEGIRKVGAE